MEVTATELKTRLGRYLDIAETEAVIVEKSGRLKSALISYANYQEYKELKRKLKTNKPKANLIDILLENPIAVEDFEPLSREAIHER